MCLSASRVIGAIALAVSAPALAQPITRAPDPAPASVAASSPASSTQNAPATNARLFIASDSTAQNYGPDRFPQAGWGQFLSCWLVPETTVENRAIGGRSTRTFIAEGRWDRVMSDLRPGDAVLIQFGHNDASRAKPERHAAPQTVFRDNLLRMVWQARGAKAVPVLITPVARRAFGPDGKSIADFAEWSAVTREVAATTGTALIDLEADSRTMIDAIGPQAAQAIYLHYPPGAYPAFPAGIADDTHFSQEGAKRVAALVAASLGRLDLPIARSVLSGTVTRKECM